MSTVGYGSGTPDTDGGRLFAAFYMLFGVSCMANFVGELAERPLRAHRRKLENMVTRQHARFPSPSPSPSPNPHPNSDKVTHRYGNTLDFLALALAPVLTPVPIRAPTIARTLTLAKVINQYGDTLDAGELLELAGSDQVST